MVLKTSVTILRKIRGNSWKSFWGICGNSQERFQWECQQLFLVNCKPFRGTRSKGISCNLFRGNSHNSIQRISCNQFQGNSCHQFYRKTRENVDKICRNFQWKRTNSWEFHGNQDLSSIVVVNNLTTILPLQLFRSIHQNVIVVFYLTEVVIRAGHVPTFLKSFRSVLERGPSTESYRSRSFFKIVPFSFRSVPFHSVLSRKTVSPFRSVPFRSWRSLFEERFHPSSSVLSQRTFPSPQTVKSIEQFLKPGYLNQYFNNIKKI